MDNVCAPLVAPVAWPPVIFFRCPGIIRRPPWSSMHTLLIDLEGTPPLQSHILTTMTATVDAFPRPLEGDALGACGWLAPSLSTLKRPAPVGIEKAKTPRIGAGRGFGNACAQERVRVDASLRSCV